MPKARLEAFSDGVIAVIITIMVLEMKVPHGADLASLAPLWPVFLAYVLSYVYVGIYWNNHHHLMHAVQRINGSVLGANSRARCTATSRASSRSRPVRSRFRSPSCAGDAGDAYSVSRTM